MLLLDGEIEAAAGAVVGAQNQHHIFVADSAAQGFFVTHQCHGMDGVQTLYQILANPMKNYIVSMLYAMVRHHLNCGESMLNSVRGSTVRRLHM